MYRVRPGTSGQVPQLLTWAWLTSTSATISRRTDQTNLSQNEQPQDSRRNSRRCLGVVFGLARPVWKSFGFHGNAILPNGVVQNANLGIGVPGYAIRTSALRRTGVLADPARFELRR